MSSERSALLASIASAAAWSASARGGRGSNGGVDGRFAIFAAWEGRLARGERGAREARHLRWPPASRRRRRAPARRAAPRATAQAGGAGACRHGNGAERAARSARAPHVEVGGWAEGAGEEVRLGPLEELGELRARVRGPPGVGVRGPSGEVVHAVRREVVAEAHERADHLGGHAAGGGGAARAAAGADVRHDLLEGALHFLHGAAHALGHIEDEDVVAEGALRVRPPLLVLVARGGDELHGDLRRSEEGRRRRVERR